MKTRVKELRTAAKMTQQQLADLVRVSSRTIISIENHIPLNLYKNLFIYK